MSFPWANEYKPAFGLTQWLDEKLPLPRFVYNAVGFRQHGVRYLKQFCGPMIFMAPFMFPIEVINHLARPLSLALRLFGNIMGEHILSGVFLMLGISLMTFFWPSAPVGIPLHLPFLFLSLLVGTIQALVFTLLGMIYLLMVLPHEHDDHHGHAVVVEEH